MKILVISRTPWNNSNSFGNTFSNLFGGMPDVEVYNICCQNGSTENDVVKGTLQMSESSVIRGLKGDDVVISQTGALDARIEHTLGSKAKRHKSTAMLIVRDLIWKIGSLKWKKAVKNFVDVVRPDVIYLPIYASWYMCDIDRYAIICAGVPVVGHITDDIWNYSPTGQKLSLSHFYRWRLRRKEYRLIQETSYIEVFADNMKQEYERLFNVPCHVIGKGLLPSEVRKPQIRQEKEKVHFVYTGGIGGERYDVLMALAKAFSCQSDKKCCLDIYSATPLTDTMKAEMDSVDSIVFHGAVNGSEVRKIQLDADFLVHVEGFSKETISSTRMSFSTKIPDYLSTGNVMLAIGPSGINSIDVLRDKGIAVVCDNISELPTIVSRLVNDGYNLLDIQQRAYEYLIIERNIVNIQSGMLDRLKNLVDFN